MDTAQEFDSLDLQKIFDDLPDDKKLEFLKDLQAIVKLSDEQVSGVARIIGETIKEFEDRKSVAS